jgi:two-component system cell cycle response regulator
MNNKESILIVDDDESICKTLSLIFSKKGYGAETAGSGREALQKVQGGIFNVALLDIKLPDVEGVKLLPPLKETHPDMAILMVTAYASVESAIEALNEGASAYITKPLNMDELLATVRETLEKQRLIKEKHEAEKALERTNRDLKRSLKELERSNQKILEQQKSVIEEERLKVLLQMAGATAHELNQPLTSLLGTIDLVAMFKDKPKELAQYMSRIEEDGQRIAEIVKRIQNLRYHETKSYLSKSFIIDFDQRIRILSVEDSEDDFETINAVLGPSNQVSLCKALNIEQAMQVLNKERFDLVLLDYFLPDGSGLDFLKTLDRAGIKVPVIVVTGRGNEMIASQVMKAGAYDYLPKEMLNKESLSRSITNTMEKVGLKREINLAQEKMADMSTRDELTGLYNRRYLMGVLEREVSRAKRYETDLALCMLDLDHFKRINDTYGHPAGDIVLSEIARMLKECIRQSDLVCRYGGEEFVVILPNTDVKKAKSVTERFRKNVAKYQFKHNSSQFQITVSVGIASYGHEGDQSLTQLIEMADKALYQAKRTGRNKVIEYSPAPRNQTPDGAWSSVGGRGKAAPLP